MRDPVALTGPFGFRVPLSFSLPLLRVRLTVVVFVRGTLITRALGFASVEPAANDQFRAYEGRSTLLPPPSTALKNQAPWMPEQEAP